MSVSVVGIVCGKVVFTVAVGVAFNAFEYNAFSLVVKLISSLAVNVKLRRKLFVFFGVLQALGIAFAVTDRRNHAVFIILVICDCRAVAHKGNIIKVSYAVVVFI